jgi:hypothetical protein
LLRFNSVKSRCEISEGIWLFETNKWNGFSFTVEDDDRGTLVDIALSIAGWPELGKI